MALDFTNARDQFPNEPNREQIIQMITATKRALVDHFGLKTAPKASLNLCKSELGTYLQAFDCVHTQVIPQLQKWFPQYEELIQESFSQWIPPPTAAELL